MSIEWQHCGIMATKLPPKDKKSQHQLPTKEHKFIPYYRWSARSYLCTFLPARRAVVPKFRSEYGASAVAIQPPGIRGNRYSSRTGKVFYADRPLSTALYVFALIPYRALQFPLQLLSARWERLQQRWGRPQLAGNPPFADGLCPAGYAYGPVNRGRTGTA